MALQLTNMASAAVSSRFRTLVVSFGTQMAPVLKYCQALLLALPSLGLDEDYIWARRRHIRYQSDRLVLPGRRD